MRSWSSSDAVIELPARGDVEENGFSLAVPVVSFAKWRYYSGTEIARCEIGLRDSITSRFVYSFQRSLPLWAFASSLRFGMSEALRANASRTAQLISLLVEDREAKQTQNSNHAGHGQPYVGMSSPALWVQFGRQDISAHLKCTKCGWLCRNPAELERGYQFQLARRLKEAAN
jgi:hypothetical protein